jgi:sialate O-acetylesterase
MRLIISQFCIIIVLCGTSLAALPDSEVSLARIFTDDMVLQREEPVRIYGTGDIEGETVTVSFGGQMKTATVNKGMWEVWLDPMKADTLGQTLTITAKTTINRKNILVGDVWVLGGQSNMMTGFNHFSRFGPIKLVPIIQAANQPLIRVSYVDWPAVSPQKSGVPQEIRETPIMRHSKWYPCVYQGADVEAQALLDEFSPPGYFFATNLVAHTQVPVGLIMACLGATKAQWWMPLSALKQHPELQCYLDENDPNTSYLYNSVRFLDVCNG